MRVLCVLCVLFIACDSGRFNDEYPSKELYLDGIYIDYISADKAFSLEPAFYLIEGKGYSRIYKERANGFLRDYFWVIDGDTMRYTFNVNKRKLDYGYHNIKFVAVDFKQDTSSFDSLYFYSNITLLSPINRYGFNKNSRVVFEYTTNMDSSMVCLANKMTVDGFKCEFNNDVFCVNKEKGKMFKCEIGYRFSTGDTIMYWGVIAWPEQNDYKYSEVRTLLINGGGQ